MPADKINSVGDVTGEQITINQIYAPGAGGLVPEVFVQFDKVEPFSAAWMLFSQEAVPFIGRAEERTAILRFLEEPDAFAWWAITGNGGAGKSRLALRVLQELPEGWHGGFLPRQLLTAQLAAAWQLERNTLWIIDDAASVVSELKQILGYWAALHGDGSYKLRILLLERGYNDAVGWWAELTQELSPHLIAVTQAQFQLPLELSPLGTLSDSFLTTLSEQLDLDAAERLRAALDELGRDRIREYSQGGNPLLLMLLASELLIEDAKQEGIGIDSAPLAELHFTRELNLVKVRCEAAQLRFSTMLELMFIATSCFPLKLLLDHDTPVVHSENQVVLEKDNEGLYRLPNVAGLRKLGIDVDARNRPILDALKTILGIDDVEPYLSVLEEAGLRTQRYAIQPDMIAAVLLNLMFNSPEASMNLKCKRGEFSIARLARLIHGATQLAFHEAWSAWARLSDRTLSTLVENMRESGSSIRWPMLITRELNRRRNTKVPFNSTRVFAENNAHADAPDVGSFFSELHDRIADDMLGEATISKLASSPHCWVAPYVDALLELSDLEKIQLGLVICSISDTQVLKRLTNLLNFFSFLQDTLASVITRRKEDSLRTAETHAIDKLIDALFDFAVDVAWPTIIQARDRTFKNLYVALARALTTASFAVANELRGHPETEATRRRALIALDIARMALSIAPSSSDLQFIDRNATILLSHEKKSPVEAAKLYIETLNNMKTYADADAYTAAIGDLIFLSKSGSTPQVLETLLLVLAESPPNLVRSEGLIWRVVEAVTSIAPPSKASDPTLVVRLLVPLFRFFCEQMRQTEDAEAADGIAHLAMFLANSAVEPKQQEQVAGVFVEAHSSFVENPPSEVFLRALLKGVQLVQVLFRQRGADADSLIPFETILFSPSKDELKSLAQDYVEQSHIEQLGGISFAVTNYQLAGTPRVHTNVHVELSEGLDENAANAAQLLGSTLFHRWLKREAGPSRITDQKAPPSE